MLLAARPINTHRDRCVCPMKWSIKSSYRNISPPYSVHSNVLYKQLNQHIIITFWSYLIKWPTSLTIIPTTFWHFKKANESSQHFPDVFLRYFLQEVKSRHLSCATCPTHVLWKRYRYRDSTNAGIVFISHFLEWSLSSSTVLWQSSSDTLHPLKDYQATSSRVLWSRLQIWQLIPFNSGPILYRSISVTSLISLLTARGRFCSNSPGAHPLIPSGTASLPLNASPVNQEHLTLLSN